MSRAATTEMRIGEVARRVGTTARTIRYYEEIGLLPEAEARPSGGHRVYTEEDVERLAELVRLRDLLGISLEELRQLADAEEARALLREEWHRSEDPRRKHEILVEALAHIDRQLELVRGRKRELEGLEGELARKRRRVRARLADAEKS
jgi:DNA-binding transcriptional MerR regulator